jgi:hypothetical protein
MEMGSGHEISGVVVATAIALIFMPSGFGADTVAWDSSVNGLRLGIAFGSDPFKPTLRILLQNVGSDCEEVLVGYKAGSPIYDSLKFTAMAPDGNKRGSFHKSVFTPIAGLVLPFSVRLNAGALHELEFPLTEIIYPSRTTATLESLVKQGYSVRVQFEADRRSAEWASLDSRLSHAWIGSVSSAEISPPH